MSLPTIEAARKLSNAAQNKLSKQDLLKIINSQSVSHSTITQAKCEGEESSGGDVYLTERRFVELLDERLNSKLNGLLDKIKVAQSEIKSLAEENVKIKKQLIMVESELKRKNIIIKGISEESDPQLAATKVIKQIIDFDLDPSKINAFRLGKQVTSGGRPRPILVKDLDQAQVIIRNAKKLRQNPDYKNVFMDRDLPVEIAKTSANLRKRAYKWRRDTPSDNAYVKRSVLFINDVEVASV